MNQYSSTSLRHDSRLHEDYMIDVDDDIIEDYISLAVIR